MQQKLSAYWNRVYRKIFHYKPWTSACKRTNVLCG